MAILSSQLIYNRYPSNIHILDYAEWKGNKCLLFNSRRGRLKGPKIYINVLPKGRSFTANSGTKAAILPKGRSSTTNSGS